MQLRASIKADSTDVSVESQFAPRVDAGGSHYVARTLPVVASCRASVRLCAQDKGGPIAQLWKVVHDYRRR